MLGTVSRRYNHFSHQWQPSQDRQSLSYPINRWLRSVQMFDDSDDDNDILDLVVIKNKCIKSVIIPYGVSLSDSRYTLSNGTGIVVDTSDHLCITNAHVVQGCTHTVVWINNNQLIEQLYGDVIYVEQHLDLAIIRLRDVGEANIRLEKLHLYYDWAPDLGEPVASFGGGGDTLNTVGSGLIVRHGVYPADIDDDYYTVSLVYSSTADSIPISYHTASSGYGFSGGPVIDTDASVMGILWGSAGNDEGPYYFIYNKYVYDFIKRAKTYIQTKLPLVVEDRHTNWLLRGTVGRKLGLIYAVDVDTGLATIRGFLPQTGVSVGGNHLLPGIQSIKPDINLHELIDETIVAINGQQFNDIKQLIVAVDDIGTDDGEDSRPPNKKMTLTVSGVHNGLDIELTANVSVDEMPINF
ncbi:uncharacterized protein LOC128955083 [Oppia nitens]|uniref:uncharacterized protein LOC128955083 n=1 Tax=Oppia nitens TaxID=1686743 RepID=UPI0023DA2D9A|nr:uncharacterized protein LOC128955083 [Oppia nitens]